MRVPNTWLVSVRVLTDVFGSPIILSLFGDTTPPTFDSSKWSYGPIGTTDLWTYGKGAWRRLYLNYSHLLIGDGSGMVNPSLES